MTILVVGASGATGRLLVQQLLNRGHNVKVIVRSSDKLREVGHNHDHLSVIKASILALSDVEMARLVNGCAAVASCLGHNLSWRGIYGPPRRLVTDATRRLCNAIKENKANTPTRFVLMNTAGNSNRDLDERLDRLAEHLELDCLPVELLECAHSIFAAERTNSGSHAAFDDVLE